MNEKKCTLVLFFFACVIFNSYAQILIRPNYLVETGTSQSIGKRTPFWLISNQYGLLTSNNSNEWIKIGVNSSVNLSKLINYDYAFEVIDRVNIKNEFYINQAYLGIKVHFVKLQFGAAREIIGNQDSSLSSGGLLWSGNCRPVPKLSLSVPNYTPIPFTNGFVELKGGISHGWLDNNEYIKHSWLHHKYIYIRLGGKFPFQINYGFQHFVQWGGVTADGEHLPSGIDDFMKVLLAQTGDSDAPEFEKVNTLGNHIGSHNFGVDLAIGQYIFSTYWQTIFEDSSGVSFHNIKDGLWGISFHSKNKDKIINGFLYEFINTTNQSGPYKEYWELNGVKYIYPVEGGIYHDAEGRDNYFNNYLYRNGWVYRGMTIGTPLITSPDLVKNERDIIINNRVTGHHFGFEGKYRKLYYKFFYTYTLNYGTYNNPFDPIHEQHSVLIQTTLSDVFLQGLDFCLKSGIDFGSMYGNNFGIQISLIKYGSF